MTWQQRNEDTAYLTCDDTLYMTLEVGEAWAVAHAKRLIEWVREIESDLDYDSQALEPAASLHDCGASPKYAQKDVEHAVRSRRVIEAEVLPHLALNEDQKGRPLKAIESHDYRDPRPTVSNEALLLRKADMLGVIRMIGMAREFARGPKNVAACSRRILARRDGIQGRFTLPRAQTALTQCRV
jgi:HD superfamily phosphodiesterase